MQMHECRNRLDDEKSPIRQRLTALRNYPAEQASYVYAYVYAYVYG
jgi:hypothetical protein